MSAAEMDEVAAAGDLGRFCAGIQKQLFAFCRDVTKIDGVDLPDPVTMAIAIEPDIAAEAERAYVAIETTGALTRGMTVVDKLGLLGHPPNARVVTRADRPKFLALLHRAAARESVAGDHRP